MTTVCWITLALNTITSIILTFVLISRLTEYRSKKKKKVERINMKDIAVPGTLLYYNEDVIVLGTRDGNIITYALDKVNVVESAHTSIKLLGRDYNETYPTYIRNETIWLEQFNVEAGKKFVSLWVGFSQETGKWFIRQGDN